MVITNMCREGDETMYDSDFEARVTTTRSAVDLHPPRYRIRALNGPLRDAVFDPSVRLTLGRGCDCDIQIVHNGVSRQHAAVEVDAEGKHVLVDLESTNGVFVDQKRVPRAELTPGTVFEVMRYSFVYEVDGEPANQDEQSAVPRKAGTPADRTTISYVAFSGDAQAKAEAKEPKPAPPPTTGGSKPARYHSDVVADIADYRSLRTRILRGEPQSPPMQALFRRLEHRMRRVDGDTGGSATRWAYRRFPCRIPATVRLFTGDELPVQLIDVGVDGAKVAIGSHNITPDTLVWLAVERERNGAARTLVFPGRAVWVSSRHLGVSFSGAPGWSLRGSESPVERTLREVPLYEGPEDTAVMNLDRPLDSASAVGRMALR